jgi:hypothetical protein
MSRSAHGPATASSRIVPNDGQLISPAQIVSLPVIDGVVWLTVRDVDLRGEERR